MDAKTYPEFSTHYPLLLTTFMKRPVSLYPNEIGVVNRNPDTGQYQRFTWGEWYDRTCRLANALKNVLDVKPGKGFEAGDRVGTLAQNTTDTWSCTMPRRAWEPCCILSCPGSPSTT